LRGCYRSISGGYDFVLIRDCVGRYAQNMFEQSRIIPLVRNLQVTCCRFISFDEQIERKIERENLLLSNQTL